MLHSDFHGTGAATVDYRDRLRRCHNLGVWCGHTMAHTP